jgi:hypothetical protein
VFLTCLSTDFVVSCFDVCRFEHQSDLFLVFEVAVNKAQMVGNKHTLVSIFKGEVLMRVFQTGLGLT